MHLDTVDKQVNGMLEDQVRNDPDECVIKHATRINLERREDLKGVT